MANALIILNQIIIMFIFMAIGFVLFKKQLITIEGSKSLAHLLLYVVLPCVVVKSFSVERTSGKAKWLVISIIGAAVLLFIAMIVSHVLFKKNTIEDFGAAFSNAGFMGFPLITAVLGADAVFYAAGFVAFLNALQWTYGQSLLANNPSMRSPKTVIKNPLVVALAIGLVIFFSGITLPRILMTSISSLAALNAPLAMVILGVYFAQTEIRSMFTDIHLYYVSGVRLLLIPVISVIVMKVFMSSYETISISLLLAASAPIGSNVAVYAQKLNQDYTYAVKIVCLSTILSVITMPLIILLI
jgi:hypothetical protein